jgi:hypothetical protein
LADILGPSGQPLPPNPLLSQKSDIPVNTGSAQKAFADLQRVLDNLIKSFAGNWEKVTSDRLKAEERFYRAIGDKDKERKVMLQRYRDEAIAAIKAETDASLDGLKAKNLATGEFERQNTEITRKAAEDRARIESETMKQMRRGAGLHGVVERVTAFAGGIGGPVGSTVAGFGNLITNPWTAIPAAMIAGVLGALEQKAAYARTGVALGGAGLGFGISGERFTDRLFAGISKDALSPEQQRQLVGTMAGSRGLAGQAETTAGIAGFRSNLGLLANIIPDVGKNTEFLTAATKAFGAEQSNLITSSYVNASRMKITNTDALQTQFEMQKALRNITNDGTVAASVLFNITDYLKDIGASEDEKNRIGLAVGQAGANLTLPQIAGMFAFTHGGRIPGPEDLFGAGGPLGNKGTGTFQLMGEFLTKVGSQFQDPTQRMFAAGQLQTQFMPGLRLQDIPKFFDIANSLMSKNMTPGQAAEEFKKMEGRTPQVAAAEGINKLVTILGPETRISNELKNFSKNLFDAINRLIDAINGRGRFNVPSPLTQKQIDRKAEIQQEHRA